MSVKMMSQVWELDLPSELKLTLLALADHADDDGGSVFPSVARIAWKCGCSTRTIQRRLRELVELNVLVVVAHDKGGRGKATEYRLVPAKGDNLTPFLPQRVTPMTQRVTPMTQKDDRAVSPQPSGNTKNRARRSAIKNELVKMMSWRSEEVTQTQWGRIEKAAKQLDDVDAFPDEIAERARNYRTRNPGKLTPLALAANWSDCATAKQSDVNLSAELVDAADCKHDGNRADLDETVEICVLCRTELRKETG